MTNQFDITKHKWTQDDMYLNIYSDKIVLEGAVYMRDAVVIAKHFGIIPQSETKHIHQVGVIGEMKRND